ncbi:hypothetical protein [Vreelandella massiliensis]|uniref:hypothetical protein n=1 Tax=Vreelandella massiliensis TaxID=1816686 RepID=UPI00096A3040|nr:hypothetical protein [Halomonas massiliensis]
MPQKFSTQSIRTAKQVMEDAANVATQSNINDWYDTTTLARERAEFDESLFYAISVLLKEASSSATSHAIHLAKLGSMEAGAAADIFHNQTDILNRLDNAEGAAQ